MKNFLNMRISRLDSRIMGSKKLYDIASINKAHVFFLILKLIVSGEIKMSDRVSKFLTDTSISLGKLTIRELLLYVPYYKYGDFKRLADVATNTNWNILKFVKSLEIEPKRSLDKNIYYNNVNSIICGEILKKIFNEEKLDIIFKNEIYKGCEWGYPQYQPKENFVESFSGGGNLPSDETSRKALSQGDQLGCAGLFASAAHLDYFVRVLTEDQKVWDLISKVQIEGSYRLTYGFFKPLKRIISPYDNISLPEDMVIFSGYTGCKVVVSKEAGLLSIFLTNMRTLNSGVSHFDLQELHDSLFKNFLIKSKKIGLFV